MRRPFDERDLPPINVRNLLMFLGAVVTVIAWTRP